MKRIAPVILTFLLIYGVYGQVDTSKSKFWMMTYFVNGQDYDGPRLAFSSDTTGIKWQIYSNTSDFNPLSSSVLFKPVALPGADGSRCRDPMTVYDSINRRFNMVWTTEWTGKVIGWDTSSLLKPGTWGPQVALSVGTSMNASFSWAPEILWDDIQNKWMLYWSVSVSGVTTRIYYSMVTGSDFKTFSTPQVLLNPGYDIIDADISKIGTGNYQMLFKDERNGYKYVRRASGATTPQGNYSKISEAISAGTMEGPCLVKQGGVYHAFIDRYGNQGIHCYSTKDVETTTLPWTDGMTTYGTNNTTLKVSHCHVIEVPKMLVKWMFYNDGAWETFVKNKTPVKEFKMIPSNTPSMGETKTFDLLGKVVNIDLVTNQSGVVMQANNIGRLPSGFYVTGGKKEEKAVVNINPGK